MAACVMAWARVGGRASGAGAAAAAAASAAGRRSVSVSVRAMSNKSVGKASYESPISAALAPVQDVPFSALTPAQKVVEGTKTGGSVFVIAGALALAGTFMWSTFRELFLADTPDTVRDRAISEVKLNPEITMRLGEGLQPTGQVAMQEYQHGDYTYTRVAFQVFGDLGQGKVNMELKKPTSGGSTKYRYFFVDVAEAGLAPAKRVIIYDNRGEDNMA